MDKRRVLYKPDCGFYWLMRWLDGVAIIDWRTGREIGPPGIWREFWVGPVPTMNLAYDQEWPTSPKTRRP